MNLTGVGQTKMFMKFKTMRNSKGLRAIACEDEGNELLVDHKTLIEWNIIPKGFPLPMDPQDRVRRLMTYLRKWWISKNILVNHTVCCTKNVKNQA